MHPPSFIETPHLRRNVRPIRTSNSPLCALLVAALLVHTTLVASSKPQQFFHGAVVSQDSIASEVGACILKSGGNAIDAAVATAFALAVTHPAAGNIGGGGFLLYRPHSGNAVAYDFRETAPAASHARMFLIDGKYNEKYHHSSHASVGVPGTVAGLHLAWKDHGQLPWKRLVIPAIRLALDGFPVSPWLASSLRGVLTNMAAYPASLRQFSLNRRPYRPGEILKQPDLAATLDRIARNGPDGFYKGKTARLLVEEMKRNGGLITLEDLESYQALRRTPISIPYRGFEILSMPPPSSGGVTLALCLNILEGFDLRSSGRGSATMLHWTTEALRRAFAERAKHLGDPESNPAMPLDKLLSQSYADLLRSTIRQESASKSDPTRFEWTGESLDTTHFSVVDRQRNAVALTYTLEQSYGSMIVAPGTGFLLNNEMGDFNAEPGITTPEGKIGTRPNWAAPGKRMLSSMSPTIVVHQGKTVLVTGSPGGRTIISTVLATLLHTIDFGLNAQESVDAPRFHHQWLPDTLFLEKDGFSADTLSILRTKGHTLQMVSSQGAAQVIAINADNILECAADRRAPDSLAAGY